MNWLIAFTLATSMNMGESTPAPRYDFAAFLPHTEARIFLDTSDKQYGGFNIGTTVDVRAYGPLLVGLDYRHRNGGVWMKDVWLLRTGVRVGPIRLIARKELTHTNALYGALARLSGTTGRFRSEIEAGWHAYQQQGQRQHGYSLDWTLGVLLKPAKPHADH